jgi:hypothetical protein
MRAARPHKAIAALVILQPAIVARRFAILSASWATVTGIINEWPGFGRHSFGHIAKLEKRASTAEAHLPSTLRFDFLDKPKVVPDAR